MQLSVLHSRAAGCLACLLPAASARPVLPVLPSPTLPLLSSSPHFSRVFNRVGIH